MRMPLQNVWYDVCGVVWFDIKNGYDKIFHIILITFRMILNDSTRMKSKRCDESNKYPKHKCIYGVNPYV